MYISKKIGVALYNSGARPLLWGPREVDEVEVRLNSKEDMYTYMTAIHVAVAEPTWHFEAIIIQLKYSSIERTWINSSLEFLQPVLTDLPVEFYLATEEASNTQLAMDGIFQGNSRNIVDGTKVLCNACVWLQPTRASGSFCLLPIQK